MGIRASEALTRRAVSAPVPRALPRLLWRGRLLNYLFLGLGALVMIAPFVWMVGTSFKSPAETVAFPPTLWPAQPTLANYVDVANRLDVVRLYWNTTFVAVIKTVLMVYTGALLGYVFAKFEFPGKNLIFFGILCTMIIPFEVYMIPLYLMMVRAKLGDTYTALVLPSVFSAYAIFLFRQFMFTIPNDLIDAARADGAGEFHIFHRIILPLSKPILVTMTSFYFMWEWNDFLWPLIVITDPNKYLLSVGLATLVGEHATDYGLIMAGASLAILPILVVFLVLQRHVIRGITMTGMK
jgi:multiple sugar transport system permease protein